LASVIAGNGCTGNTVRNCEIACGAAQNTTALTTWGILMNGTTISNTANGVDNDNNTFQENRIIKCRHGIVTRGTTTNLNENIQVIDNIVGPTSHGVDQIGIVGIYMQADNNSVVRGNTVQFVGGPFANTSGGADRVGIAIGANTWSATSVATLTSTNYTVTRNLIHDIIEERTFSAAGMILGTTNGGSPTNNVVANNMIYNVKANGTAGDMVVGIGISGGHTDQVVHNSIFMSGDVDPDAGASATTNFGAGIRTTNTAGTHANLTLKNNVIHMDLSSSSAPTVRYYCISGTAFSYTWGTGGENNNDYYYNAGNPQCLTGGLGTSSGVTNTTQFTTLANWQTAYTPAQDAASIAFAPPFVSSTNLHISGTPAQLDNTGASVGVATDFDGDFRTVPPDMGADEFTPAACGAPVATASTQQDCANTQYFINVNLTSLSGSPSVDIGSNYVGNPGADLGVTTPGIYQIGPFPSNTPVTVSVLHNGNHTCDVSLGSYNYNCADFGQNALSFDGTNDRVECGTGASISITGTAITLEAWIYPTSFRTSSFEGSIINKEGPNLGYMLRCGGNGILSFALGNGLVTPVEVLSPAATLTLNTWQHVAATYDGVTMRIFKDGVQVGSLANTQSLANTPNQLMIGDYSAGVGTRNFPGKIDEVRIWNTVIDPATLAAYRFIEYCGVESGLQAYYRFNQGVENANNAGVTTLIDQTANANTGTLINFALNGTTSNWVQGKTGLAPCVVCNSAPAAGTITGTTPVCSSAAPTTLTLTGATSGIGISYQWSYGPPGNPTANLLGTAVTQSTATIPVGTWEVQVAVTCSGFGTSITAAFAFVKNQTPSASASSNSPVCVGAPLNLTGTTDIGTTFNWTGPNSFASSSQNPNVSASTTLAMAGSYTFTATAAGCSSAPSNTVVVVNPAPTIISTTATPNPTCFGGTSQLNVSALVDVPFVRITEITFFRTGTGQTSPWPATIPTGPDDYVELNNTSGLPADISGWTFSDHLSGSATNNHPSLTFPPGTVIAPNGFIVIGLGVGTNDPPNNYYVTGGTSGAYSSGANACFILRNGSTIVDAVATNTATFNVGLGVTPADWSGAGASAPSGNAGSRRTAALDSNTGADWVGSSVTAQSIGTFNPGYTNTNQSVPAVYLWTPNTFLNADNIANPLASGVNVASQAYNVTVTSTAGCTAQGNLTLTTSSPISAATITGTLAFCSGGSTTLTAVPTDGAGPYTYLWSPGGQTTAAISVNVAGSYSCQVTDNCGGSVNTGSVNVVENSLPPVAVAPTSGTYCAPTPATLNASGASTYSWAPAAGLSATTGASVNATPSATTTYTVTGTDGNGCVNTATSAIVSSTTPVITSTTAVSPICPGSTSQLQVNIPGPAAYCASTHANGCSGDDITNVTLNTLVNPTTGCGGASHYTYFTGGGAQTTTLVAGGSYTVSVSFGTDPNQYFGAWIDYNNDGVLAASEVLGLAANAGANGTSSVNFTVPAGAVNGVMRLRIVGGNDLAVTAAQACGVSSSPWGETQDYDVTITGGVIAYTYAWSPAGNLNNAAIANPVATLTTGESYTVTVTNGAGCSAQGTTSVAVAGPVDDSNPCTLDACLNGVVTNTFQDADGDLTCDANDDCPNDPNKISPGQCGCGVADTDSDSDGTANCNDGCPNDPNKVAPGICGCGVADTDSDGDGTANCNDGCPNDPDKISPGTCGCGTADVATTYYADTDGDGFGDPAVSQAGFTCIVPPGYVTNNTDLCPTDPNKVAPGLCGCGVVDVDLNNNNICDTQESEPSISLGLVENPTDQLELRLLPNGPFYELVSSTVVTVRWVTTPGVSVTGAAATYADPNWANALGPLFYVGTSTNGIYSYASFATFGIDQLQNAGFNWSPNVEVPFFRVPVVNNTGACVTFELVNDAFQAASNSQWYIALNGLDMTAGYIPGKTNACVGQDAVNVTAKAFLEGPFVIATGRMSDGLRAGVQPVTYPLIPATQPYSIAPWNYPGTETVAPAVLTVTGDNAIVDWVMLEVRSAATPTSILARRAALIQRDGDIVDTDGSSAVSFVGLTPGSYHLAVRHRNHLGIMTFAPLSMSGSTPAVDFTLGSTATFGTDARKTVGSSRLMWAGNVVADDRLKYTGASNDRDPILTLIGGSIPTAIVSGYLRQDVTMDGRAQYTGSGNDRDPILINIGGSVPTGIRLQQLP
jgi:hypothetical protein